MELKLENGRYVPAAVGLKTVSGAEELMQRVTMKLTAKRGKFFLMPDYGSRLYTLISGVRPQKREEAVRAYVAEALQGEPVVLTDMKISVSADTMELELRFSYSGGSFTVNADIREET